MAFASVEHWEDSLGASEAHRDWLCSYATLRKIVLDLLNHWPPPLPNILLVGTGLSNFAEELYDSGFKYITVLDFAASAAEVHRKRAASRPARTGLRVVQRSVAEAEWPELDGTSDGGREFGIVVDKGVIDCLLTARDGLDRAGAAVTNLFSRMTTPGVWISVSHSPPGQRRDLYCTSAASAAGLSPVYWHEFKVKRVRLPPLEYAATSTLPGPEQVEDMPEAGFTASAPPGATQQQQAAGWGAAREADQGLGQGQGEDDLDFRDDVAYIYMMTK
ncbi:hypothetical protein HYH02_013677 [Chlamydomonas schloesseri]|uniref:Methyltransferase type 11 domain-containing protein n=1 Tax=Chlamydomonas schloesseri TaxID=2026947 RepID=A0A835T1E6_9CHLO|nr:hypothetical protein HYH02_013677 [Chlamydomonas schloesseri]|eukprot:KAG2430680.1 hypothetical protein HYH02_013677 [Chlamydomonas schloesseri]